MNLSPESHTIKSICTNFPPTLDVPIPDTEDVIHILYKLIHISPTIMMPANIIEFEYRVKHGLVPEYLLCAIFAAGMKHIKNKRTHSDRVIEALYARRSLELIKALNPKNDLLALWACVFIIHYCRGNEDQCSFTQAMILAKSIVLTTKLHMLDAQKSDKISYQEIKEKTKFKLCTQGIKERQEFKRRIWWLYYITTISEYYLDSSISTFEDSDIKVNFPENDFVYRYGGNSAICPEITQKLNNIAENPKYPVKPQDNYSLVIKMHVFLKSLIDFVSKRWKENYFDQDQANLKLVKLIKGLGDIKFVIESKYSETIYPISSIKEHFSENFKLSENTDSIIFSYYLRHFHKDMVIYLYQSELVRDNSLKLHPGRVKSAKTICLKCATDQVEMLSWALGRNFVDTKVFMVIPFTFNAIATLINMFFIGNETISTKYTNQYTEIINVYKALSPLCDLVLIQLKVSENLLELKREANHINKPLKYLNSKMLPFSISPDFEDVDPWIVPLHGSFYNYKCCYIEIYSEMEINKYLEIPALKRTTRDAEHGKNEFESSKKYKKDEPEYTCQDTSLCDTKSRNKCDSSPKDSGMKLASILNCKSKTES
ncbi:hypothetical protein BB558_002058 [Smittium angustum]|uniref:Transcription factor domain-containing protein n=1 Tax=Smittium angustum TaxID=133377 RepID=A0A2U1J9Q7_SMIAN|nr:hypothetical protein BB558_006085 [Smittium angustum]PWA01806.1 hypothetical protein BB558_002058 [Smittium angustum]